MSYNKIDFYEGQTLTHEHMNDISQAIVDNQNDILSLKGSGGKYNQWAGKTWYAYGTSLTATGSGKYVPVVQALSGMTVVNKGIGGGGIAAGSKTVKSAIMNTTDGKLNADLITLEVGANDKGVALGDIYDTSNDTFCGNLNQCIRYLQENTTAQIVIISSTNASYNASFKADATPEVKYGSDNHTVYDSWKATEEVCKINSVHYIPAGESAGLGYARIKGYPNKSNPYLSDSIHHTSLGGKNLGYYIWYQLKNIPLWFSDINDNSNDETITYYTVTNKYVDVNGTKIKDDTTSLSADGTIFNISVTNAETISGYTIKSVNPSGSVVINKDTTITFTYEANA